MAEPRSSLSGRSIFGLLIVALGILLTLDNLGLFEFDEIFRYWPVALMVIAVGKMRSGQWGSGIVTLLFGMVCMLPILFDAVTWGDLWRFWPLALIGLGVSMMVESFFPAREVQPSETTPEDREAAAEVRALAFLSSVRRVVTASDFRYADLTALLGGCEIDLTAAELAPEGGVVEIFAFWGGVGLRVPKHWVVEPQLTVLMGSVEDGTEDDPAEANEPVGGPRLTIKGLALMGGLEIRN